MLLLNVAVLEETQTGESHAFFVVDILVYDNRK